MSMAVMQQCSVPTYIYILNNAAHRQYLEKEGGARYIHVLQQLVHLAGRLCVSCSVRESVCQCVRCS